MSLSLLNRIFRRLFSARFESRAFISSSHLFPFLPSFSLFDDDVVSLLSEDVFTRLPPEVFLANPQLVGSSRSFLFFLAVRPLTTITPLARLARNVHRKI